MTAPVYSNFVALARAQPDLKDFLAYLQPTLEKLQFLTDKIGSLDSKAANLLHNRETARQVDVLLHTELKSLVENYCALEIKWRNCEIIKTERERGYTSKDVLLQNLENITAIVDQLQRDFQQENKLDLLKQNRYLMQKSAALESEYQFDNKFDYAQYQATAKEVSIEPLIALMAQNKQQEKELLEDKTTDIASLTQEIIAVGEDKKENLAIFLIFASSITFIILFLSIYFLSLSLSLESVQTKYIEKVIAVKLKEPVINFHEGSNESKQILNVLSDKKN